MFKKKVNDYFKKYSYNTRHRKQKWKSQIKNLEQIKGQCYLPMSTHFLNQIGTETTTLNQMLPGVVHMQKEVWALYNYSERFEFFFFFLVHICNHPCMWLKVPLYGLFLFSVWSVIGF